MFTDLKDIPNNTVIKSDICVIGSGAAGLSIALEFIHTRYNVVVLESGNFNIDPEVQEAGRVISVGEPLRETRSWIRAFGGTLNVWGGGLQVLNEIDFEKRPSMPYSGWPIPYSEVAKYWSVASTRSRLPPLEAYDTRHWLPNIKTTAEHHLIDQNTHFDVIHHKSLNFIEQHRNFRRSKNIHIYLSANVTYLQSSNGSNKIEQVKARSIQGNSIIYKARYFILAAGGIENAGLLLNSRDKMNKGLGNHNDLVGRFYMNHPKGHLGDLVPFNKKLHLSHCFGTTTPYGRMRIVLAPSPASIRKNSLLNHHIRLSPVYEHKDLSGYQSLRAFKHQYILGMRPTIPRERTWKHIKNVSLDLAKLAHVSWKKIRNAPMNLKSIVMEGRLEQPPNPANRVYLSDERNCFGQNKLALDWRIGSVEKESFLQFHHLLKRSLKNIGNLNGDIEMADPWPISNDASHHLGTTRMAHSDKEGVVDKNCMVFGIANLFIAGSSIFPTGGGSGCPTLTIVALSIRLADHLKTRLS